MSFPFAPGLHYLRRPPIEMTEVWRVGTTMVIVMGIVEGWDRWLARTIASAHSCQWVTLNMVTANQLGLDCDLTFSLVGSSLNCYILAEWAVFWSSLLVPILSC